MRAKPTRKDAQTIAQSQEGHRQGVAPSRRRRRCDIRKPPIRAHERNHNPDDERCHRCPDLVLVRRREPSMLSRLSQDRESLYTDWFPPASFTFNSAVALWW
jgi:hypothetical protein